MKMMKELENKLVHNDFLAPETRCDFYVDTKRKKIWLVQLNLLGKLQEVCDKYGLKCIAAGGTLLGAVRHNGFIPWDDDLDVVMSRSDFTKLCDVAEGEFEEPYFFQTCLTDRAYFLGFGRLRDSRTSAIVTGLDQHKYNNGIFIDINIYDAIPEKKTDLKKLIRKLDYYKHILNNYYYLNISITNPIVRAVANRFFECIRRKYSFNELYQRYTKLCNSYSNSNYKELGFLTAPMFLNYRIRRGEELKLIPHKFEFTSILIPEDYHYVLSSSYGNYMEFPPVDKRGGWHEGVIAFDPEISYIDYYRQQPEKYKRAIDEIDNPVTLN